MLIFNKEFHLYLNFENILIVQVEDIDVGRSTLSIDKEDNLQLS